MATLNGTSGNDTIQGTASGDTINGLDGSDTLSGLEGPDTLNGGNNADTLNGGDGGDLLDGGPGADTMNGGIGNDTYIVDNKDDLTIESASAGTDLVKSSISRKLGANLENLTLTGTADINGTGNELNNILIGNSGSNILDGLAGADKMKGGAGNDTYMIDDAGDQTIEDSAAGGIDKVKSSVSFTLQANLENLTLLGTAAIDGTGNGLANVITGNSAANHLDGQGGADTMSGGGGNDTYEVDNAGDVVIESSTTGGTDLVNSFVSFTLSPHVENLTLLGTTALNGTGNGLGNIITGNGAANVLSGGDGNDTLQGLGGADTLNGGTGNDVLDGGSGNDSMTGGTGNDTYYLDSLSDVVVENHNQGVDTVNISFNYTLGSDVENGIVTGSTGRTLTGNELANALTGGVGADTLNGLTGNDTLMGGGGNDTLNGNKGTDVLNGEAGDDQMTGGLGDDTYYVDSAGDVVAESSGGGTDKVNVTVNYTLGSNVENGEIIAITQSPLTLNGNDLDNALYGKMADEGHQAGFIQPDILNGFGGNDILDGGRGGDLMAGGTGNDTYYVQENDQVVEASGEGIDTLMIDTDFVGAHYTMADNVEIAIITVAPNFFGPIPMNVTGNSLANSITGFTGVDIIHGAGGNDSIDGGGDDDELYGEADNDFVRGQDGDDTIDGGAGDDFLIGGLGQDLITTGTGVDTIVYNDSFEALFDNTGVRPNDDVTDFDVAFDKISLIAIDANMVADGFQGFHFTGSTFDHTIGDVWLQSDNNGFGDGYFLFAEMNGDQFADMAIHLTLPGGITSFTVDNLVI